MKRDTSAFAAALAQEGCEAKNPFAEIDCVRDKVHFRAPESEVDRVGSLAISLREIVSGKPEKVSVQRNLGPDGLYLRLRGWFAITLLIFVNLKKEPIFLRSEERRGG